MLTRSRAHAADLARHRPGARTRDDDSAAPATAFAGTKHFDLSLDPEQDGPANTTTKPCPADTSTKSRILPCAAPSTLPDADKITDEDLAGFGRRVP